jgi:hypothetical protein
MNKLVLIAATAVVFVTPNFSSRAAAMPDPESKYHRFSAEDHAAFTDARIAALKAGLKLTPSQEKNWPALEAALRDAAKARSARMSEWRDKAKEIHERNDVIEGLQLHAKGLSALGAEIGKVADAAKPLFDSLDDAQKRRFGVLLHVLARPHWRHWRWEMRHGEHSDEHKDEGGD